MTVGSGTAVRKLHRQHKNLCNGGRNTGRRRYEEQAMRRIFIALGLTLVATLAVADGSLSLLLAQHMGPQSEDPQKDAMTPEERMNRRFPQPVRVGDLISLAACAPPSGQSRSSRPGRRAREGLSGLLHGPVGSDG